MTRMTTATAIGLALAATPALAEITPLSVWEQLDGYYESMGFTVETEAVEEAGATVTVRGLRLMQDTPTSKLDGNMGDLVLTTTGDGGVSLDMADEMTMALTVIPPEDDTDAEVEMDADGDQPAEAAEPPKPVTLNISIRAPGEAITVREDGEANLYEYSMPTLEIALDRVEAADGKIVENPAKAVLTNLTGSDRIENGAMTKVVQSGKADNMTISLDVAEEGEGSVKGTISVADLTISSDSAIPADGDLSTEIAAAMKAGLKVMADITAGQTDIDLAFSGMDENGMEESGSLTSASESMALNVSLADGRARYAGNSGKTSLDANLPGMPIPVSYGSDSAQFDLDFPVMAGADPQPFKVVYGFDGLTLSDSIWGLFDPQSILPRDPAKLAIDLSGLLRLDSDILDAEAMAEASEAPGQFTALTVNNVQVAALGADVSVTGELTGPEGGDLTTPIGKLNGRLVGVNGLLDKLAQAGLLPEDQGMMARMMLGMFAKPDPQDGNVLTSEIEFKDGGQIFANGQQVK